MTEYRQKPVVVEAMQFNAGNQSVESNYAMLKFLEGHGKRTIYADCMLIETHERWMRVGVGDWIVNIEGDMYSFKPEVFAAIYEPIEKGGVSDA